MREDTSANASVCTPAWRWRIFSVLSLLGELHIDTQQAVLLWWQPQAVPAGGQEPVAWHLRALLALAEQRIGPVED